MKFRVINSESAEIITEQVDQWTNITSTQSLFDYNPHDIFIFEIVDKINYCLVLNLSTHKIEICHAVFAIAY